jgi:hypothetical protein
MCNRVFYNLYNNDGLKPKLGFEKIQDVLWGTSDEIPGYAEDLFNKIFSDLFACQPELDFSLEDILCDYVPYAKDSTFWNLLFAKGNTFPAIFYGIHEDTIIDNIGHDREKALTYLYIKCESEYLAALTTFTSETDSFTKIDKVFLKDFVYKSFIPILKKHIPDESSLGIRVKYLIFADLSHVPKLMTAIEGKEKRDYYKQLINASSNYILKLEHIQAEALENFKY